MPIKKITKKKVETVLNTISGIIPNLLNIQIKVEGGEVNPRTKIFSFDEATIDFNLGNKK